MRCPHHSCRDTFQSRMPVIQCSHTLTNRSGRIRVSPAAGRLERRRRERPGLHEPLRLEPRLHDVVAALAAADDHLVGLLAVEVAARGEVLEDRRAGVVAVHAVVPRARVRDACGVVEDRRHRQAVAAARLVVVVVVGGRDLHRARPEGRVDDRVRDDRHVTIDERDPDAAAHQGRVPGVVGVHRDGGVAEDRLGPGRRDGHRGVGVGLTRRLVEQVVADRPDRARLGRRDDLEVADARPRTRGTSSRAPRCGRRGRRGTAARTRPGLRGRCPRPSCSAGGPSRSCRRAAAAG